MIKKPFVLLCFLVFYYSIAFPQNGIRGIDYNARSIGRGGTEIGFFDSPSLMMVNPAGLSFIKKPALNINSVFTSPASHFKNYRKDENGNQPNTILNNSDGDNVSSILPSISYVHSFRDSRLTLGAGIFTMNKMDTKYQLNHQLFANPPGSTGYLTQTYHSKFNILEGCVSGSYLVTPEFSIGLTGEFIYSSYELAQPLSFNTSFLKGSIKLDSVTVESYGKYFSDPRPYGLGYKEFTTLAEMTNLKTYSFGGKIGIAYKMNDNFSFGACYSLPVRLNYKNGNSKVDMTVQFNEAKNIAIYNIARIHGMSLDSSIMLFNAILDSNGIKPGDGFSAEYSVDNEFKTPQSFGFGFMYSPLSKLRLGFDFEWINWSKAYENMKITLKGGTNSNMNKMFINGSPNNEDLIIEFPMKWKDAILLKLGGEYDVIKEFTIRAGYTYSSNPVPDETIIPVLPEVIEHHFMAGCSINYPSKLILSLAIEYGAKNTLTGSYTHKVASEYANSESSLQNLLEYISLTYNF
jgi:long-subunit fatty acid transport protein